MASHIVKGINNNTAPKSEWGFDSELVELFNQLNKELFDNALPLPAALYYKEHMPKANSSGSGGVFWSVSNPRDNKTTVITISYEYKVLFPLSEIRLILLHEMCHWYCYYHGLEYHDNDLDFVYNLGWRHGYRKCKSYNGKVPNRKDVEEKETRDLISKFCK